VDTAALNCDDLYYDDNVERTGAPPAARGDAPLLDREAS
jgi:hypothetical protein